MIVWTAIQNNQAIMSIASSQPKSFARKALVYTRIPRRRVAKNVLTQAMMIVGARFLYSGFSRLFVKPGGAGTAGVLWRSMPSIVVLRNYHHGARLMKKYRTAGKESISMDKHHRPGSEATWRMGTLRMLAAYLSRSFVPSPRGVPSVRVGKTSIVAVAA